MWSSHCEQWPDFFELIPQIPNDSVWMFTLFFRLKFISNFQWNLISVRVSFCWSASRPKYLLVFLESRCTSNTMKNSIKLGKNADDLSWRTKLSIQKKAPVFHDSVVHVVIYRFKRKTLQFFLEWHPTEIESFFSQFTHKDCCGHFFFFYMAN